MLEITYSGLFNREMRRVTHVQSESVSNQITLKFVKNDDNTEVLFIYVNKHAFQGRRRKLQMRDIFHPKLS
jgi:hypothetical protein